MLDHPFVSIVVIGKNEESNLPYCFDSIKRMNYPQDMLDIIYVDSGSTDNSVVIAEKWGIRAVNETGNFPSAALGRNRGIKEARYKIIHFMDGDMTIGSNYLEKAIPYLNMDNIACVIGKLDERYKDKNPISWLLYYNWAVKKPGFVDAPGAGGTFLKKALIEAGGYNPEILRGEETELGIRLREKGYGILMIDEIMGVHDYGIKTLGDLIRFFLALGQNFGRAFLAPSSSYLYKDKKVACNILIQSFILLFIIGLICITQKWLFLLFLPLLITLYVIARFWNYYPEKRLHTIAYFLFNFAGKPIMTIGIFYSWWKHIKSLIKNEIIHS